MKDLEIQAILHSMVRQVIRDLSGGNRARPARDEIHPVMRGKIGGSRPRRACCTRSRGGALFRTYPLRSAVGAHPSHMAAAARIGGASVHPSAAFIVRVISGFVANRLENNTLANSKWTIRIREDTCLAANVTTRADRFAPRRPKPQHSGDDLRRL